MVCLIIIFNILFNLLRELCVTETVRHGESDKPQATYPIAAYAVDIAYMIKQLGLDKAVAVGHSMGGLAVLQLAALHPDRVAGNCHDRPCTAQNRTGDEKRKTWSR